MRSAECGRHRREFGEECGERMEVGEGGDATLTALETTKHLAQLLECTCSCMETIEVEQSGECETRCASVGTDEVAHLGRRVEGGGEVVRRGECEERRKVAHDRHAEEHDERHTEVEVATSLAKVDRIGIVVRHALGGSGQTASQTSEAARGENLVSGTIFARGHHSVPALCPLLPFVTSCECLWLASCSSRAV